MSRSHKEHLESLGELKRVVHAIGRNDDVSRSNAGNSFRAEFEHQHVLLGVREIWTLEGEHFYELHEWNPEQYGIYGWSVGTYTLARGATPLELVRNFIEKMKTAPEGALLYEC